MCHSFLIWEINPNTLILKTSIYISNVTNGILGTVLYILDTLRTKFNYFNVPLCSNENLNCLPWVTLPCKKNIENEFWKIRRRTKKENYKGSYSTGKYSGNAGSPPETYRVATNLTFTLVGPKGKKKASKHRNNRLSYKVHKATSLASCWKAGLFLSLMTD